MKKIVLLFGLGLLFGNCRSVSQTSNEINQKLDSKTDKEIVLLNVVSDSRCPEGTQCIWAGEITIEVAAYENKKMLEQMQFTINRNNMEEIKKWFTEHLPKQNENLKGITVIPYPKEGVQIQPQDYKIVLKY